MEFPHNAPYGVNKFPQKRRSSRFFAFFTPIFVVIFAVSGCEFFDNSMAGYFLDNTEVVAVTGIRAAGAAQPAIIRPDGIVFIPSKDIEPETRLELVLFNPRNFIVRQELLGVPAGRDISARQTGSDVIEVVIKGAERGDEYNLVLAMQSPDGLRDFVPYTIRIQCDAFKEITGFYFDIGGKKYGAGPGTETGSGSIDSFAITVIVPGGTDLADMTPPVVIHNGASYSPMGQKDFSSTVTYTVWAADGTSRAYTVTVKSSAVTVNQEITITGIINESLPVLSFSSSEPIPAIVTAGTQITISISPVSGGVTVTNWYIEMAGPETLSPALISVSPDKVKFTVPPLAPGFYNVTVIATVHDDAVSGDIDYSGSFGLIAE
jgi:hypothetical protein